MMFSSSIVLRGALSMCLGLSASFAAHAALPQAEDEVTPEVQQLYARARAAKDRGDTPEAVDKYRAIIKLAPHLAAAYNNLGMIYFNAHDYAHATEVLKRGLELNPNMPTTSAMLGMSYFQLGQNGKAAPLLKAALRANPKDDQIEMMLVRILVNEHNLSEATTHLNAILARNPSDQEAWYVLGKTYLQLSEDALGKVNQIDPDSVVAHEIAGEIDQSMHNYDLAVVEYKKAIDKAPNRPGTHMHMADALWNTGKWAAAQTEFRAELKNDPFNCIAHWKLANSLLEANESSQEALDETNQAIDRCPTLMQARVDRARALIRLGKQPDALPDLLEALKQTPGEPSIHFLLASVYRAQGKKTEAQAELQTYERLQREASAAVAKQAGEVSAMSGKSQ